MARRSPTSTPEEPQGITAERAARLCRLLRLLGSGGQTRAALLRRLNLDVRGFYRDLETLRRVGINVFLQDGRYVLQGKLEAAINRVPFPDPRLNVGEAAQISKGRSSAHRKIKDLLQQVLPS